MADDVLDQNLTWAQVVERTERIKALAQRSLREMASVKALADSCFSVALDEVKPCLFEGDEQRHLHDVVTYAVALALARYGELFPHDRSALERETTNA